MPELPEVAALAAFLAQKAARPGVGGAGLAAFAALKPFAPPLDTLAGRTIAGCTRHGKFLDIDLSGPDGASPDPLHLVFHLARGGWVRWSDPLPAARAKPGKTPLALRVRLVGGAGFDVTEMGTEKRVEVYVVRDANEVEGVARLGPDPLDPAFDAAAFTAAMRGQGGNVKKVLTDQA